MSMCAAVDKKKLTSKIKYICKNYGITERTKIKLLEAVDKSEVKSQWIWIADDVVMCKHCQKLFYKDDDVNAGLWDRCPKCGAEIEEIKNNDEQI